MNSPRDTRSLDELLASIARPESFLRFPPEIQERVATGVRGHIPSDHGAYKLIRRHVNPADAAWNVLAAFATTGEITAQTAAALLEAMPAEAHFATEMLVLYMVHHGERGPVQGWGTETWMPGAT